MSNTRNRKNIKIPLKILSLSMSVMLLIVSCSGEDNITEPEIVLTAIDEHTGIDEATGVIYVKDLPGSVGNTYASGHISVFYNMENHRIINPYSADDRLTELPEAQKISNEWDLAFTSIYNSYIAANNGTVEGSPGYGGSGKGALVVLDVPFDDLNEAPSNEVFDAFMEEQSTTGWEDFPPGDKGWFFYSLNSHVMSAIAGVTIVIRTPDGRYAKMEMQSLYLNSPENPTVNTPAPYFTFRYYLQQDGSRNQNTQ